METICIRKLNDFVDDLLSMTERTPVKRLELRQFKIVVNIFLSGVKYLLKRMPSVTSVLLDLSWGDGVGRFDDNLCQFITSLKYFGHVKEVYLRVEMSTQNRTSLSIIWQALLSVIIQQRTKAILSQFEAGIVLILREGCIRTGKSIICRYYKGKWWTRKRDLKPGEKVPIPGNITNIRNK